MSLEPYPHFIHVLGAIVWLGGGTMLFLIGIRARQSSDIKLMGDFAKLLPYVGLRVLMPATVAVLVTGVWLVLIEYSFTQLWVQLALGAFIVAFLIGAIFLSRIALQLERVAKGAGVDRETAGKILVRWIAGYGILLIILLVVVWDMVFKPGP